MKSGLIPTATEIADGMVSDPEATLGIVRDALASHILMANRSRLYGSVTKATIFLLKRNQGEAYGRLINGIDYPLFCASNPEPPIQRAFSWRVGRKIPLSVLRSDKFNYVGESMHPHLIAAKYEVCAHMPVEMFEPEYFIPALKGKVRGQMNRPAASLLLDWVVGTRSNTGAYLRLKPEPVARLLEAASMISNPVERAHVLQENSSHGETLERLQALRRCARGVSV